LRVLDPTRIRNFSIIAHIDHGKSTLADRILEATGAVSAREMSAQFLDDMELERERGITIKARSVRLAYRARDGQDYVLNLIDTPGHVDFTYEVSRSLAACEGAIPPPRGDPDGPATALIFDSWFDPYHGAVVLVRVFDGQLAKGRRIRMMATGKEFLVTRVGVLAPRAVEVAALGPGEVGVLMAAIKEVGDTKIGDTITDADRPAAAPLPGFLPVKPMVFSGLYPAESAQYDALRDAVEKLRLNDSSFTYEPETSLALGVGFRCG